MSNYGQYSFDDLHRRRSPLESSTSLTWILLTTVIGAYILYKALVLVGYPIWPRISQLAHMSADVLHLRGASESSDTASGNDTMQRTGGLLSSIFGHSSESLLLKGVRGFKGAFSSGPSSIPPGLCNISNSCYQNSVIQGLAALPSLRDYLSTMTAEHPSFTTDTTGGALHELISKLNDPANLGQSFWVRGKLKSMSTFAQQDAQEYYSKILDELDNEVKKASSSKRRSSVSWVEATKDLSGSSLSERGADAVDAGKVPEDQTSTAPNKIVPNPLDGLIAQRVGCTSCGYSEGLSLINFNCITVSLGRNNGYDIRECLDEYTKLEYIDGVECAKCTLLKLQKTLTPLATTKPGSPFEAKLKTVSEMIDDEKFDDNHLVKTLNIPKKNWVQSSKSKQIVVARAPKSLVLHVNRSIFDEMTGAQYKNTAGVSYPRILDLGNWCLGNAPSGSRHPDMSVEEWPRDPTQSMLQETDEPTTTSPFQYRLRAAVTHFGSHGNGHYVCYRPHTRTITQSEESNEDEQVESTEEQWWRCSDDNVYAIEEEQAHQANVFMLFYERLDAPTELQTAEVESVPVMIPVAEDAPLPPENVETHTIPVASSDAEAIPLPDDEDLFELIPPEPAVIKDPTGSFPYVENTAPAMQFARQNYENTQDAPSETTSHDTETETSEAESEDAPSTQHTSDSEAELVSPPTPKPILRMPPHTMRTAGNTATRQGNRQSLPLVSAT
jgi:ubiquitin carboxyl-terminal hydrolase 1